MIIVPIVVVVAGLSLVFAVDAAPSPPHPVKNPQSPLMLTGDWIPKDARSIDFAKLPRVRSQHAIVSDRRGEGVEKAVCQHNYLAHHDGRYWAMWSDGPGREDRVGQRVNFANSADGLVWTRPKYLTPEPPGSGPGTKYYATRTAKGFRWISRGFWQREGELLALAALDEAGKFFGPSLELRAFRWNGKAAAWDDIGVVFDNAINNFPPKRLPTGTWMMSRRTHDYRETVVHFLVGGDKSLNQWESFPVLSSNDGLAAEEPYWWVLPDQEPGGVVSRQPAQWLSLSLVFNGRRSPLESAGAHQLPRRPIQVQRAAHERRTLRARFQRESTPAGSTCAVDQRRWARLR